MEFSFPEPAIVRYADATVVTTENRRHMNMAVSIYESWVEIVGKDINGKYFRKLIPCKNIEEIKTKQT